MMANESLDIAVLRRFAPLDDLRQVNLTALSKKASLQTILAGRPLFREGDRDKKTYYLVGGDLELRTGAKVVDRLRGDTPAARNAVAPDKPRRYGAYAVTAVEVLVFDSDLLDALLTWDETGIYDVSEFTTSAEVEVGDWMAILLQTGVFHHIPPSNLQAIFMRMQRVVQRAGDVVIKQGDPGDYFYAITQGRCAVTRETPSKAEGLRLAELGPGDTFGEEALISESPRNATVSMLTDGTLMRLNKSDFDSLLKEAMQQWVSYAEAAERVASGAAQWLDVRLPSEFASAHLPGAINLPLCFLRPKIGQLDTHAHYVVVCDTGLRSAAAAFILTSRGYNAVLLKGGMPAAALVGGH